MNLLTAMQAALGETWAFYFKAHSFHWNVRGPLFSQLHEFFGDIYEDAHGAVDGLAERIRAMDKLAPASLDEIAGPAMIEFTAAPDAAGMVLQLVQANGAVIAALQTANTLALSNGQQGLGNYLQERLDRHAKWGWMLAATASGE